MSGNHECHICGDTFDSKRELEEHALQEHEVELDV
ncbi:C2H2-type zinc finger protein [Halomontanus rarus]